MNEDAAIAATKQAVRMASYPQGAGRNIQHQRPRLWWLLWASGHVRSEGPAVYDHFPLAGL